MSQPAPPQTTFNFSRASVVLIDANQLCLQVMTGILAGFGFRKMQKCLDLSIGTDAVKRQAVDLILLDPAPFGEMGYDFVRWMRSEKIGSNAAAPVIIVTAFTSVRMITACRRCGADYVIAKPFSTSQLLERIVWVAESEGRRGELVAPAEVVSSNGSGVELW
ncbi:MAG: response regulator [Alphaproteobacteria bacterium]|nr:response regulator [Alphaproteobacteria bacterium]